MFLGRAQNGNIGVTKPRGVPEMSEAQFDQKAWLARIGYSGPITPTLETLNRLVFAHSHSIPYETLDIMLGRPPKFDVPTLQHKMIASRRGGHCFEQNMLFRAGLRSLGGRAAW
jgi:N-hydroxyarylamine O-acetyltransferase